MPRIVGYARTSTEDQKAGLEAQKRDLLAAGCHEVFAEQVSSVAERGQLDLALAAVEPGDTVMVTKPDRLARSTIALLTIEADLSKRGVGLIILSMGGERLDTRNPTSKLMLTILAGVAAWEREIMLERQREGIAKARSAGKYKGRKPTRSDISDSVWMSHQSGMKPTEVATVLALSPNTVRSIIKRRQTAGIGAVAADAAHLAA